MRSDLQPVTNGKLSNAESGLAQLIVKDRCVSCHADSENPRRQFMTTSLQLRQNFKQPLKQYEQFKFWVFSKQMMEEKLGPKFYIKFQESISQASMPKLKLTEKPLSDEEKKILLNNIDSLFE